jgi:hypothetical protein
LKRLFLIIALALSLPQIYFSQCCGGCNPIGGNTNQGTLPKFTLQFNTYYKTGYSEGYMQNDHKSDFNFVKNARNDFVGVQLGYGIFNRLTAQVEAGYYINRTQNFDFYGNQFTLNGRGGSSVTLSAKYSLFKDTAKDIEFTIGVGAKLPWSTQPQIVDGVQLTEDVQPSNAAYGLVIQSFLFKAFDETDLRIFLMNSVTISNINPRGFKDGNTFITSFFVSKTFLKNFSAIGQVRNEIRDYAYQANNLVTSSGGYRFVFVPQINYSIKKKYNISVLYEMPIYQYYYGIQLKDMYAFSLNLNIRLGLSKKANALCEKPK